MSRSRKKTPILSFSCAKTEKFWKTNANRKMRRCPVDAEPPKKNEYSDVWTFPKDGKSYYKVVEDKWMRK